MVGDSYNKMASVADTNYMEVKPIAGQEVTIHNVYHPGNVELRLVNAGFELPFRQESDMDFLTNCYLHLTENYYLRVYNISGGTVYLAVDGIVTKE